MEDPLNKMAPLKGELTRLAIIATSELCSGIESTLSP